jgi:hypothetical protein
MGADKNSSSKSQTRLSPKFTTKDSHTSLPRSCSYNEPTNPRNTSQHTPKRKHNSRDKRQPICRAPGGQSARSGRTVHKSSVDCPRGRYRRSILSNRTTRTSPGNTDGPSWVCERSDLGERSVTCLRTVRKLRATKT